MTRATGRPRGKPRAELPPDDDAQVRVSFLLRAGGLRWIDAKAAEVGSATTRTDILRAALKEYATRHPLHG